MEELRRENERLKQYLAEAIEIANFTVGGHGFFIKQQLWELKIGIDKSGVASDCEVLDTMIKANP